LGEYFFCYEVNVGAGDVLYDSDRSLLRVIHDHLLSENPPADEKGESSAPPPVLYHSKPRIRETGTQQATGVVQKEQPISSENSSKGASSWDPKKHYSVGDIVSYKSNKYWCIIAHQGQVDWTPDAAVSLWNAE
jgi:hypothetical protein